MKWLFARRFNSVDQVSVSAATALYISGHWVIALSGGIVLAVVSVCGEAFL